MDAKDFLRQLKKLDYMIENKKAEKQQWKAISMGTTAQMGGERVQSSSSQQKMENAVVRYTDIEREINECIDRLYDTKKDVINVIEQLNTEEYDILHKKYVQYLKFDEIAAIKDKSTSSITSIHGIALKNVQKILDERERGKEEWKRSLGFQKTMDL